MNIAKSSLLPLLKYTSYLKFSARRAVLSVTGTSILLSFLYPQAYSKFELYSEDDEESRKRINKCPSIKGGYFSATPYLASGTLQCIFAANSSYCDPNVAFREERLDLPNGGKIGMHWATHIEKKNINEKKTIVMILPGLTASSKEPYVKNIVSEVLDNGYDVVVYHNRGNECDMILPTSGYLDPIEDFKHAVEHVKEKYPEHRIFAVGHSFGANLLVNYLGKFRETHSIDAAASIANPFDFEKAAKGLTNTLFDEYLAKALQVWATKNKDILINAPAHYNLDFEKAMTVKSMLDFDDCITRRILGVDDLLKYYQSISSVNVLKNVNVPLLCMHSRDDPFLHESSIPVEAELRNKNVTLLVTNIGGHVGWFHGLLQPKRWFPKPTVEFLNACHEEKMQKF